MTNPLDQMPQGEWDRFVYKILQKFIPLCRYDALIDVDDLRQEAWVGLLKAAESYDPTRGPQFSTYAWIYVKGALCRFVTQRLSGKPVIIDIEGMPVVDFHATCNSGEGSVDNKDMVDKIFDLIEGEPYAVLLTDHFVHGKTYRVLAKEHGVSHETINIRIKKLMAMITKRLDYENAPVD